MMGLFAQNNPPTNFTATFTQSPARIEFSWVVPQSGNPQRYAIYVDYVVGGTNVPIGQTEGPNDTNLNISVNHSWLNENKSFRLAAIYPNPTGPILTPTIHDFTIAANPPRNLTANFSNDGGVNLAWTAPANTSQHMLALSQYRIYRNGNPIVSVFSDILQYTDHYTNITNNTTYTYSVKAVYSIVPEYVTDSNTATITRILNPPTGLDYSFDMNSISTVLTWYRPTGSSANPTRYHVYRNNVVISTATLPGSSLYFNDSTAEVNFQHIYYVKAEYFNNETVA